MKAKIKNSVFMVAILILTLLLAACGADATQSPTAVQTTGNAPTNTAVAVGNNTTSATTTAAKPTNVATATVAPTTTAAATTTVVPTTTAAATTTKIEFDEAQAYQQVKELVDNIGVRAVGTPGHEKAADYLEGYFKKLGLKTERQTFDYKITSDKGSAVRYSQAGQQTEFKAFALTFSSGGNVTGALVDVGLGKTNQIKAGSLSKKIALIQRGEITFYEKANNAKNAGAVGVIFYNNIDSELETGTLGKQTDIPVVGLSLQNGQKLRDMVAANPLEVTLESKISSQTAPISNVSGIRPAAKNSATAPLIIIGGHYDSVTTGPGANDNASGTAITLELARVLQNQYPNVEFRFIGFGGEELGLLGSREYANRMSAADQKRLIAMINIDMVTVGNIFYIGGTPDLSKLAFGVAAEVGVGNVQGLPATLSGASDHASFADLGMPYVFFNREDDPNYHRATDTSDKVAPKYLGQVGTIVTRIIDKIATN